MLFGIEGAWLKLFCPEEVNCALCGSSLGLVCNHPGQRSADSCLHTELNAFKRIDVKAKKKCKQGLLNHASKIFL